MHSFIEKYAPQRKRAWMAIEAFYKTLPVSLVDMGWEFAQRLGRQTSYSGEFADALTHPAAARIAYLPLWVIESYLENNTTTTEIEELQNCLFASSFLGFCSIRIQDDLLDEDEPNTSVDELLLSNLFANEAVRYLQRIFPSESPLWEHHTRNWREYVHAVNLDKLRDRNGLTPYGERDLLHIGHKAALLKTYPIAVALYMGAENHMGAIGRLMDTFNTAIQLQNDIQSIKEDIESAHYTYPLTSVTLDLGHSANTHPSKGDFQEALIFSDSLVQRSGMSCEVFRDLICLDSEMAYHFPRSARGTDGILSHLG